VPVGTLNEKEEAEENDKRRCKKIGERGEGW